MGFRAVGLMLGVPSLLLLLDISVNLIALNFRPAPATAHFLDVGKYGLVGLLSNGAEVVGKVFEGFSTVASWVMTMVAVVMLVVVTFAVTIYVTGTGIKNHAKWAKVVAILFSIGMLGISLIALIILPRDWIPVPCIGVGVSLYSLWVLGWKFS